LRFSIARSDFFLKREKEKEKRRISFPNISLSLKKRKWPNFEEKKLINYFSHHIWTLLL
jgi:hypothetical protein